MRKGIIAALFAAALSVVACYNDDDLQKKVDDLDKRVTTLEEQVKELNEKTVPGLQATVAAIQNGVMVSKVTKTVDGVTILFSDGTSAVIKDGANGKDGDKGEKGDDAVAPVVSVKEVDGVFYWAVNGELLKDAEGNPIPVYTALPQFRVNEGKWEVSYDEGATWAVVPTMGEADAPLISIKDDETTVTFFIGEESYVIQKEVPFYLVIENRSDIGVMVGETAKIDYSVAGVKEGDEVEVDVLNVIGSWDAKIVAISDEKGYVEVKNNGGNAKVFVYAANGRGRTDIKSITFENGELSAVLAAQEVEAEGGEVALDITTNSDYELVSDVDWVHVVSTKATRVDNYIVYVDQNYSAESRSATIKVVAPGSKNELTSVELMQKGGSIEIADLSYVDEETSVKIEGLVAVAVTKTSAIFSDGEAYVYADGVEVESGKVYDVTGVVAIDGNDSAYLAEAVAEASEAAVTAPEPVITYYGIDEPYSYVGVSGTLALNNNVYSLKTPYGATVRIVDPVQDLSALVGKNVAASGYFGKINFTGSIEVYYLVATNVKDATYKEADWTITYSYDPAETYPEVFDVDVKGSTASWATTYYSQEDFEYYYPDLEFNDINMVVGAADDLKYSSWYFGLLFGMDFPTTLDMLSYKGNDQVTYSELDPGVYTFVAFAVDEFGNATGEYKVAEITKEAPTDITFDIQVANLTHESADVTFTPSSSAVYYLPAVESPGWVESFDSLEELAQGDLDYWKGKYGSTYESYGFSSIEDLILTGLCSKGTYTMEAEDLDPESKYYAYVFALDADCNIISDVFIKEFTTEAKPESNLEFYGTANWHDTFVSTIFNMEGSTIDLDCDVYVDSNNPGVYYFDSPYWYDNIAEWFDSTPEEMKQYTGNYKEVMIEVDCSDPAKVKMPIQELGCSLSSTYGWISGGFGYGYTVDSYGTFADNTITFEADGTRKVLWSMAKYSNGGTKGSTLGDSFVVTITPGGSPVKPASVKTSSLKKAKSNRSAVAVNANAKVRSSVVAPAASSKKSSAKKSMHLSVEHGREALK
ncbi:MAG: PL29 family lyase N-terminal domain-containing protein [Bacteroidales bacterium]|nr:PL29 family lyase N-terminal domain-containing protein [Bacteroidales bacterium]